MIQPPLTFMHIHTQVLFLDNQLLVLQKLATGNFNYMTTGKVICACVLRKVKPLVKSFRFFTNIMISCVNVFPSSPS